MKGFAGSQLSVKGRHTPTFHLNILIKNFLHHLSHIQFPKTKKDFLGSLCAHKILSQRFYE